MATKEEIKDYYNQLATTYDQNRFGNTYGQYIHQQEDRLLKKLLPYPVESPTLDLACGTGRHLSWATHGLDISPAMIAQARQKYPDKDLEVGSALQTPYPDRHFSSIYAFHLFMHLQEEELRSSLLEMHRILKPGGQFLFDIPSSKRRKLIRYKAASWHGAFSLDLEKLKAMTKDQWDIQSYHGILYLPIHRFHQRWRRPLRGIDNWLCQSPWRDYASYLLVQLRKI